MSFSPPFPDQRHFFLVKTLPINYDQICRFVTHSPLAQKEKKFSGMFIIPLLKVHNFTFTACIQRVQWILAIQVGLCARVYLHPLNSSSFTTTCDPYPSPLTLHGPVRVIIALVTSGCLFFDLVCCCSLYDLDVFSATIPGLKFFCCTRTF